MLFSANTFKKSERLKSRKYIHNLFTQGSSLSLYPFKLLFREFPLDSAYPAQAAFAVPKKNFPKASTRNIIKRRMREVYRLHKKIIYHTLDQKEKQIALIIIYTSRQIHPYEFLEEKISLLLERLKNSYETNQENN